MAGRKQEDVGGGREAAMCLCVCVCVCTTVIFPQSQFLYGCKMATALP